MFRVPRPSTAFSLDKSRKDQGGRKEEPKHLAFIRKLPCCVCGREGSTEAAHLRSGSVIYRKGKTGMGTKPDDRWVNPLCQHHHREQHAMNEMAFWQSHNLNPFALSLALHHITGDESSARQIIAHERMRAPATASTGEDE